MKFATILATVISLSQAADGTDCSSDKTVCASTECCGTATKDPNYTNGQTANWAKDGVTRTVCLNKDSKTWVETITAANGNLYRDPNQSSGKAGYTFACNVDAKKTGASTLFASTAAILAAAVYMA